ncbi:hypothetical protein JHK87_017487 [Glycine soja]|nr:hypothetical protein JHK87_017487 [Glycine soja]
MSSQELQHPATSLAPFWCDGSHVFSLSVCQACPNKEGTRHYTESSTTTMKAWSLVLAALAFTLLVVSSTEVNYSLIFRVKSSSHQALKDLRGHRKDPSKQVESCFRAITPSKSNPTQNK